MIRSVTSIKLYKITQQQSVLTLTMHSPTIIKVSVLIEKETLMKLLRVSLKLLTSNQAKQTFITIEDSLTERSEISKVLLRITQLLST